MKVIKSIKCKNDLRFGSESWMVELEPKDVGYAGGDYSTIPTARKIMNELAAEANRFILLSMYKDGLVSKSYVIKRMKAFKGNGNGKD